MRIFGFASGEYAVMTCSKCGSDQWKLATLVHAEGHTTVSTRTVGGGIGVDGDGIGVGGGVAGTSGEHQTMLSKSAAPPEKPFDPAWMVGIGVVSGVLLLGFGASLWWQIVSGLFIFAGLSSTARENFKVESAQYVKDLAAYRSKKMCLRCGTFYHDDDEPAVPGDLPRIAEPAIALRPAGLPDAVVSGTTKVCPYCAETIRVQAILCKHCHSKLER